MNETIQIDNAGYIDDDILKINEENIISCPICLDEFNIVDKFIISNGCECNCIYHDKCFLTWYLEKKTCPICRENIPIQNINSFKYNIENKKWYVFGYDIKNFDPNINKKFRFKDCAFILIYILCIICLVLFLIYLFMKYYKGPNNML